MKNQKTMNIKETKIDHKTLHFLPFVPTRTRKKGFHLQREWGSNILDITAKETLNTYDLLTLLFITKEYFKKGFKAGHIGEGENRREVAGIKINAKDFLGERGVLNKTANRNTLKKSILRLKSIDLTFTNKETKDEIYTSYIYEISINKSMTEFTIFSNKKFIEYIGSDGILTNIGRLLEYGSKEQYPILLDLYLQGTKSVRRYNKKKILKYRDSYSNEELKNALKLDLTNQKEDKKKKTIRDTFSLLAKQGMPSYEYDKYSDKWSRTEKANKHKRVK